MKQIANYISKISKTAVIILILSIILPIILYASAILFLYSDYARLVEIAPLIAEVGLHIFLAGIIISFILDVIHNDFKKE